MAFLDKNIQECLSAIVTDLGRQRISEGNFEIKYFQVGDSDFDYNFYMSDQFVIEPNELDTLVKYPLLLDAKSKLDYAPAVMNSRTLTLHEPVGSNSNWNMNILWSERPAGLDNSYQDVSGYTGNVYIGAKEYFGYNSTSGQSSNNNFIINSAGEPYYIEPSQQKNLAVIYNNSSAYNDWLGFDADAQQYFALTVTNLRYHRAGTVSSSYTFKMGTTGGYVNSAFSNVNIGDRYQYLVDQKGNVVGKIFVGKKMIVIHDEEINAAMSSQSQRTWTLPAPKVDYSTYGLGTGNPILSGTTKDLWITYLIQGSGMHSNYYIKLKGREGAWNASFSFGANDFLNLGGSPTNLYVLTQIVDAGQNPIPDGWIASNISNQVSGGVSASNLANSTYNITKDIIDNGTLYDLTNFLGAQPLQPNSAGDPQFGDETVLIGSVTAMRSTRIHEMNFLCNLPQSQFTISQNPTKKEGVNARITEIALLNSKREVMVMAKAANPHERIGYQQFAIRIDF